MKLLKRYSSEMNWIRVAALLFVAGFFFGVLLAVLLKESYTNQLTELNTAFFTNLNSTNIDYNKLFQLVLIKKYKSLIILFVLCTTVLGLPYLIMFLFWKGFNFGFLLGASIVQYKLKGFVLFILYLFPQYVVYIPVMALAVMKAYSLNRQIHYNVQNRKTTKKIIIEQIPFLFIAAILLLLGCMLEAYVNANIIQRAIPSLF